MKTAKTFLSLLVAALSLTGCGTHIRSDDYTVQQIGKANKVVLGTIIGKREVTVRGQTGVGTAVGAVGGGIAGAQFGDSCKSTMTGVAIGGLVGAGLGYFVDNALSSQTAMEYRVHLINGEVLVVVQGATPDLRIGQRVEVIFDLSNQNRTRVIAASY